MDDTAETIQSEPVANFDLEKSITEKEMTVRPETTAGEKERIQIDETSLVDKSALPIETLQEEEPEMITTIANTEIKPTETNETKETKKSVLKKKKVKLLIEE